jgi:hypothetical protein
MISCSYWSNGGAILEIDYSMYIIHHVGHTYSHLSSI